MLCELSVVHILQENCSFCAFFVKRSAQQVILYDLFAFYSIFIFVQGQNGFEELRRYVKQGSDFGKDLVAVLQER